MRVADPVGGLDSDAWEWKSFRPPAHVAYSQPTRSNKGEMLTFTVRRLRFAVALAAMAAAPFLMRPDPGNVTGGIAHQHVTAAAMRPDPGEITGGYLRQHVGVLDFSDIPQ